MVVVSLGGCHVTTWHRTLLYPSQGYQTIEKSSQEETRNISCSADTKLYREPHILIHHLTRERERGRKDWGLRKCEMTGQARCEGRCAWVYILPRNPYFSQVLHGHNRGHTDITYYQNSLFFPEILKKTLFFPPPPPTAFGRIYTHANRRE